MDLFVGFAFLGLLEIGVSLGEGMNSAHRAVTLERRKKTVYLYPVFIVRV